MKPYVANETAVLRVYRGDKKIKVKTLTFKPVNNNAAGVATLKVKSAQAGQAHAQGLAQGDAGGRHRARQDGRACRSYSPSAAPGASGPGGALLQSQARRAALRRSRAPASMTRAPSAR